MRRHHYLGFDRTAGRALRQVGETRGQSRALLLWQSLRVDAQFWGQALFHACARQSLEERDMEVS